MTHDRRVFLVAMMIAGWAFSVGMASLFWLTYGKLQAKNEEAWRLLNRLTVAETAYDKLEDYVARLEYKTGQYRWKRKAARKLQPEPE